MQHIFNNNYQLCSEISEGVLGHFIHCLATHGRHVQYLNFLHTIIKAEGKYVKKCQDMIMTEVRLVCANNCVPTLLGLLPCCWGSSPAARAPPPLFRLLPRSWSSSPAVRAPPTLLGLLP